MTDLITRQLEIAQWLADALDMKKPQEKWGFHELGEAGILIAIRSLAEAEAHQEAVEKLLAEIRDRMPPLWVSGTTFSSLPSSGPTGFINPVL